MGASASFPRAGGLPARMGAYHRQRTERSGQSAAVSRPRPALPAVAEGCRETRWEGRGSPVSLTGYLPSSRPQIDS